MKRTVRSFVAVEIDAAMRQRIGELIAALAGAGAEVKWVEPASLHLTIKFLDEVPLVAVAGICQALTRAAATVEPFEMELRGAGAFPGVSRPKTIWLGVGRGEPQMIALQAVVEAALGKLGFRREPRRFTPHLTIGRVRAGGPAIGALAEALGQQADFPAGRCRVGRLTLFSSDLRPTGPVYEPLGRAALGEAKSGPPAGAK